MSKGFNLEKFIYLCDSQYEKDIKNKLIEKFYKEFEKEFNNYIPTLIEDLMSEAIDAYYSHPKGKRYKRTNQFSGGKTLFDFNISKNGRVWSGSAGEGFPDYPKIKGVRSQALDGETAWELLFDYGLHGTGHMYIGTTEPSPFEIVNERFQEEFQIMVDDVVQSVKYLYLTQLQQELINEYKSQCM